MTLEDAAAAVVARDPAAPFAYVCTPNAQHTVNVDRGNRLFIAAQDGAWMVLNDSRIIGLLAARMFHDPMPVAPGSDLTALLLRRHIAPDDAITVIGASDEVERRLRSMFGLRRIARHEPPMGFYRDPAQIERCVDFIVANPARYVFLAVGAPQSETVARQAVLRGGATGIGLCIGSSLHFATGVVRRAPAIVRALHAESVWRLLQNPRSHARRLFVESFPVLAIARRIARQPAASRSHVRRAA